MVNAGTRTGHAEHLAIELLDDVARASDCGRKCDRLQGALQRLADFAGKLVAAVGEGRFLLRLAVPFDHASCYRFTQCWVGRHTVTPLLSCSISRRTSSARPSLMSWRGDWPPSCS